MSTHLEGQKSLSRYAGLGCLGVATAFGCGIIAMFMPLVASIIERQLFGTTHIYDFLVAINLADGLGALYEPILTFILGFF